jgi:sugar phosphate isomerase/epimerase
VSEGHSSVAGECRFCPSSDSFEDCRSCRNRPGAFDDLWRRHDSRRAQPQGEPRAAREREFRENIEKAAKAGCDHTAWGVEVVKRVDSPRVKLLYDIYHMQIMEGDVIRTIRDNFQYLGHFHTGGVPGRHEIDSTQELNYGAVAKAIVDLGFQGYMAHEFVPAAKDPIKSLEEAAKLCDA